MNRGATHLSAFIVALFILVASETTEKKAARLRSEQSIACFEANHTRRGT